LSAHQFFDYYFLTPSLTPACLHCALPAVSQDIRCRSPRKTYSVFASHLECDRELQGECGTARSEVEKSIDWNLHYGTANQPYAGFVQMPDNLQTTAPRRLRHPGILSDSRTDRASCPRQNCSIKSLRTHGIPVLCGGFKAEDSTDDTTGVKSNLGFQPEYVNDFEGVEDELAGPEGFSTSMPSDEDSACS